MRTIFVIGIGAGDPEHLTVQAIAALGRIDTFFVTDKGETAADLARMRRALLERYVAGRAYRIVDVPDPVRDPSIASYVERVAVWHEERARRYEAALETELGDDQCGGFLVWGDPSLYDSTLRVLEHVAARGRVAFACEVIPGISSVQALAARHHIVLNRIGAPLLLTTGRRLLEAGGVGDTDTVVLLDGAQAFAAIDPMGLDIYWGAYLGTGRELLVAGPLVEKVGEIARVRAEARARHGWILDIYLLRRSH
jgi:precorrin-6A synthase